MEDNYPNSNFTTQRYYENYFGADYSEPNSTNKFSETIRIPDFDKKIIYLLERCSCPDAIKNILKKLKFAYFQEKVFLDKISEEITFTLQ